MHRVGTPRQSCGQVSQTLKPALIQQYKPFMTTAGMPSCGCRRSCGALPFPHEPARPLASGPGPCKTCALHSVRLDQLQQCT